MDLDSGATEEAHEQYKPDSAVVRSEQSSEESTPRGQRRGRRRSGRADQPAARRRRGRAARRGQQQQAANAPAGAAGANAAAASAAAASAAAPGSRCRDAGELIQAEHAQFRDRSYRQLLAPAGRPRQARDGRGAGRQHAPGRAPTARPREQPLSKAEIEDITRLVKDAVGFDEARGDSVNVVNAAVPAAGRRDAQTGSHAAVAAALDAGPGAPGPGRSGAAWRSRSECCGR